MVVCIGNPLLSLVEPEVIAAPHTLEGESALALSPPANSFARDASNR